MPTQYANLEPGARTYVASLQVHPNFAPALDAVNRADRKSLAWNAMRQAELGAQATVGPKLDALKGQGLVRSYEFVPGTGSLIVNVDDAQAGAAWEALRGVSELGRIVRDRAVVLDTMVVDPDAPAPAAGTVEYNVEKLNVQPAWAKGQRGEGVTVGIVDTGANVQHEALRRQYRGTQDDGSVNHDYSFFDGVGGKREAYDDHNHGSHVAGTSVGGTDERVIGMAPDAKFIAAKVFTGSGSGSTSSILKGLSWMLAPTKADGSAADPTKAPDVVSNSWGNSSGSSLTYLDAWKAFEAAGIIPVVAAGNAGPRGETVGSPGSYAESITVGATDRNDKVASFSSRGPSAIKDADGNPLRKPDIAAPGVDVVSAGKSGDQYVKMSGTSMATPGISGVAAILLGRFPDLSAEDVRAVLSESAVDLGAAGWDPESGFGRVDAAKALELAEQRFGGASAR